MNDHSHVDSHTDAQSDETLGQLLNVFQQLGFNDVPAEFAPGSTVQEKRAVLSKPLSQIRSLLEGIDPSALPPAFASLSTFIPEDSNLTTGKNVIENDTRTSEKHLEGSDIMQPAQTLFILF